MVFVEVLTGGYPAASEGMQCRKPAGLLGQKVPRAQNAWSQQILDDRLLIDSLQGARSPVFDN